MKGIYKCDTRSNIFKKVEQIPTIRDIILHTEWYSGFIDNATLNPLDVNTKLYLQFTEENYSSFVYAFAVQFARLYSTSIGIQFELNACRLEELCKEKNITLSATEIKVIDACKKFNSLSLDCKNKFSLCSELVDVYFI